jgi:hypothetical protein
MLIVALTDRRMLEENEAATGKVSVVNPKSAF